MPVDNEQTKTKNSSKDKVLWIFKDAHQAKLNAWNIWTLLFFLITMHTMYLAIHSIYIDNLIDFKKIKYSIMMFDLMCLGIVAIKENGKFPVRYLVLLPIIHYVFELIFFPTTQEDINTNFMNLVIAIIIYNSIKVFNDLLYLLHEYVDNKIKKWQQSFS